MTTTATYRIFSDFSAMYLKNGYLAGVTQSGVGGKMNRCSKVKRSVQDFF